MTHIVDVNDAKEQLQQLLDAVARGEEVTIAREGVPCAKLVAATQTSRDTTQLGGAYFAPDSAFFDPLDDDELAAWEGAESDFDLQHATA